MITLNQAHRGGPPTVPHGQTDPFPFDSKEAGDEENAEEENDDVEEAVTITLPQFAASVDNDAGDEEEGEGEDEEFDEGEVEDEDEEEEEQ